MWALRTPYSGQELPERQPKDGETLVCGFGELEEPGMWGLGLGDPRPWVWGLLAAIHYINIYNICPILAPQAQGAVQAWAAPLGSHHGEEAEAGVTSQVFRVHPGHRPPPTHLIPVVEQILGSTVGCLMWLILSTVGKMSLFPAWSLFGCFGEGRAELLPVLGGFGDGPLELCPLGCVTAVRCSAPCTRYSSAQLHWEGPQMGQERAKNRDYHGRYGEASQHVASGPASRPGWD